MRIATAAVGDDGNLPKPVIGLLGDGRCGRECGGGNKRSKKQVADAVGAHGSSPRQMCVMGYLIRAQCVQTLVRRNKEESSYKLKHIKVNLVPTWEQESTRIRFPVCLTGRSLCRVSVWRPKGSAPGWRIARP